MLPVLQIGPFAIQTPGLLLLIGIYLGLILAERRLLKEGLNPHQFYNLCFIGIIAWILGARLFFIGQNFEYFRTSPLNMISLDISLLDPFGGYATAIIALLIYGKKNKLTFWATLDALTPTLAIFSIFLGLAHFASGTAFGIPTSLPWGIDLWGAKRHPSQVYETLAALFILALLWGKFGKSSLPGKIFLIFISISAGAHLVLEAWRGDSVLIFSGIRLTQVLAWGVMALGFFLLERIVWANKNTGDQHDG